MRDPVKRKTSSVESSIPPVRNVAGHYSRTTKKWSCSEDNQILYISSSGIIKCKGSEHSHFGRVIDWMFSCSPNCEAYPGDNENFECMWDKRLELTNTDFAAELRCELRRQKRKYVF
ncbi:Hypothetical predicted protein [Mytilus galloprovincialis]|uniref:Uncharacterized protein n=1 Tax=Mytilus galloprovincialis TaxID=29158 RepID=A0A8B6F387_MYTGA|nr:Hypothetical predicted protein [Mytilus galloprovincialis]